ncbi:MAG: MFS transporter [Muribaculaceae bacterium]|nr:MFS transporter [Muribaculaceae bacterium]
MADPTPQHFSARSYPAIFAVLMVLVMTVLDVTIVNVALPVLAADFGVSDSNAVWIVTIYQLIITMLLLPVSAIGDHGSYRRTFLTGTIIFTSASLGCALSPSFGWVLASRALQGVGAACVMGVNIALTRLIYPRNVLGRGLALNAMVIAIATAAGPTIAGSVLSVASWHWLFLINLPFGLAAFFIGKAKLPSNPPKDKKSNSKKFDWISGLENMIVFGMLFYGLGMLSRQQDPLFAVGCLVVSAVVGVLYIRRQLTLPEPMLPVDLFRSRLYSLSISTSVALLWRRMWQ